MGYVITEFEATPNPNALKLHLNQPISNGTISYLQPEHGAEHAVASKLFAIPGVRSVMLCGDFLTVNKDPGAEWRSIKAAVKRTLAGVDEMERIQGF